METAEAKLVRIPI